MSIHGTMRRSIKRKCNENHEDEALQQAVEHIINEHTLSTIRGNDRLLLAVKHVEEVSRAHGLSSEHIYALANVAASGKYGASVSTRLIRSLIPSDTVPQKAVVTVISWMCCGRPPLTIQVQLVKWILLVYNYLDGYDDLHALYGVIFYFLEVESMCKHVCHLLYLITRRDDVQFYRVRALLNLQKRMGKQPFLAGLLSIYRMFYPNLISVVIPKSLKTFFPKLDRSWASDIRTVQAKRAAEESTTLPDLDMVITVNRSQPGSISLLLPKAKRRQSMPIVEMVMSETHASKPEKAFLQSRPVMPVVLVKSFKELMENIDRLELPGQIAAALSSPLLRHLIACHPDWTVAMRLSYWLGHALYEEFLSDTGQASEDSKWGTELLKKVVLLADVIQEGIPVCESFLVRYLQTWNGQRYRSYIFRLITRFHLHKFQFLNEFVLEPLRNLFMCSSVYFKCEVVICWTRLLYNFATVELPRYRRSLQTQTDRLTREDHPHSSHTLFPEAVEYFLAVETILEFVKYADKVFAVALPLESDNALLTHCILEFYEMVCRLTEVANLPIVVPPHCSIVQRLLVTNNPDVLTRLCSLMCRYREAFTMLRNMSIEADEVKHVKSECLHSISNLNVYLMDISDALWRYRAFQERRPITMAGNLSLFTIVSEEHIQPYCHKIVSPLQSLSIHMHPAMLGLARKFLTETQPEGRRVHPHSIKGAREVYLEFLKREHFTGIPEFINTFINRVVQRRDKSEAIQ